MLFEKLNISEPVLRALDNAGYKAPTPIQEQAIPVVLSGRDLLGCAQTGTGKTAAFAIPIIELLNKKAWDRKGKRPVRALILTPTRELAGQISDNFRDYGRYCRLRHTVVYGGVSQNAQVRELSSGVDILIATPGRLLDLMAQGYADVSHVDILVLDEADRMLDMGFIHDIRKVISAVPQQRQTLFFSATMPANIRDLAFSILRDHVKVEVAPESSVVETVDQKVFFVEKTDKRKLLMYLLENDRMNSVLVFSRTKHGADRLARELSKKGIPCDAIHGDKSQNARQRALDNFKAHRNRVLIATDIAARGIDVDNLSHVVNFDLPNEPETYVHRIGRTGRAGRSGVSFSFCDGSEVPYFRDIKKLAGSPIESVTDHPFHNSQFEEAAFSKGKVAALQKQLSGGNTPNAGSAKNVRPKGRHQSSERMRGDGKGRKAGKVRRD